MADEITNPPVATNEPLPLSTWRYRLRLPARLAPGVSIQVKFAGFNVLALFKEWGEIGWLSQDAASYYTTVAKLQVAWPSLLVRPKTEVGPDLAGSLKEHCNENLQWS